MEQRVVAAFAAVVLAAGAAVGVVAVTSGGGDAPQVVDVPPRAVPEPGSPAAVVTGVVTPASTRSDAAVSGAEDALRVRGADGASARAAAARRLTASATALERDAARLARTAGTSPDRRQVDAVVRAMRDQAAANRLLAATLASRAPTARAAAPRIEAAWAAARATRGAAEMVGVPSS